MLLACFALPMTSCTTHRDEAGKLVSVKPGEPLPPGVRPVTTYSYLVDELTGDPWTWLQVAFFAVPALVVVHAKRRPAARLTRVIWFMEPLLIVGVILSIWLTSFFFRVGLAIGTYVAMAGIAIYSIGWIGEAYGKWRAWRRRRLTRV